MQTTLANLAIDPLNVRRRDDDAAALAALAANLISDGQLEPLLVRAPNPDGPFLVSNGGRRMKAFEKLIGDGRLPPDHKIDIRVLPPDLDRARLASAALAVNFLREDLHPVDAFEGFAAMIAEGFTPKGVAERYATDVKTVNHYLRLAALAPDIRRAWRAGEIADSAAEAFVLEPDQDRQRDAFAKLKKAHSNPSFPMDEYAVRRELLGDERDLSAMLKFVGPDAYEESGGAFAAFLFPDEDGAAIDPEPLDRPLLKRLADGKIEAERQKLLKQGWGFVDSAEKHKNWRGYAKAPAADVKTKEGKKGAGCIFHFDWQGEFKIERGLLLPGAKKKKKERESGTGNRESDLPADAGAQPLPQGEAARSAGEGPSETADRSAAIEEQLDNKPLPASLIVDMNKAISWAAQDAVAEDPALALRLAVAALTVDSVGAPVVIDAGGLPRDDEAQSRDPGSFDFAAVYEGLRAVAPDELLRMLAHRVARAISLDATGEADRLVTDEAPRDPFAAALARYFGETDYFKRAGKLRAIEALAEIDPAADIASLMKKKAAELAALAADKAKAAGWLPRELRTAHYQGPGAPAKGPEADQ